MSGGARFRGGTLVVPRGVRHLLDEIRLYRRPEVIVYPTLKVDSTH